MPAFSKIVSLFAFALSASALATPLAARGFNEHHALLARKAAPEPMNEVRVVKPKRLRRRGDAGRCSDIASSTSSTLVASSTSSDTSSTAALATAVQNVAVSSSVAPAATTEWSSSSVWSTSTAWTAEPATTSVWSSEVDVSSSVSTTVSSVFGTFFSGTNSGDGTFYSTGLGACGITNTDADYIAAAAYGMFDSVPGYNGNPNENPVCGKSVVATYGGKSVTVQITDRCAGCTNSGSLDFSPAAFQQLADESVGRIDIEWTWA